MPPISAGESQEIEDRPVSHWKQIVLIVLLTGICLAVPLWMTLHPRATSALADSRLFVFVMLVLCFTPIYPLYRRARVTYLSEAVPLFLLIAGMILSAASIVADAVFHLDDSFLAVVNNTRDGFIVVACLLFIWNGVAKRFRKPPQ